MLFQLRSDLESSDLLSSSIKTRIFDLCFVTILTCDFCFFLSPLGGRVSHEAFYRGRIVDKHREADKGRRNRNRRYAHDGDLLGIVGSAPRLFFHHHRLPVQALRTF